MQNILGVNKLSLLTSFRFPFCKSLQQISFCSNELKVALWSSMVLLYKNFLQLNTDKTYIIMLVREKRWLSSALS